MTWALLVVGAACAAPGTPEAPDARWTVRGPDGVPTAREIDARAVFGPEAPLAPVLTVGVQVPSSDLAQVAASALRYLRDYPTDPAVGAGVLGQVGVTADDLHDTLVTVVAAENARRGDGRDRLSDPSFLADRFVWRPWTPDAAEAARHGVAVTDQIRLTKYLVYVSPGCPARTDVCTTALYAVPDDEESAAPSRLRYTRQQVFAGVYEPGGEAAGAARPLVWLSRDDVNRAIMQGSVEVVFSDGTTRRFNVHESNNIPYDRGVRDPNLQARYWYFREVDTWLGYGPGDHVRVAVSPGVTVAGDVFNLGLGALVGLVTPDGVRLAVLADTGGAFQPNLYQLDWFAGVFPSHGAFVAATAGLGERVSAGVLVARRAWRP